MLHIGIATEVIAKIASAQLSYAALSTYIINLGYKEYVDMADTKFVSINSSGWTSVASASESGFITNSSTQEVYYLEAATLPSVTESRGHILYPKDFVSYSVTGSQNIYMRSTEPAAVAIVTPD